MGIPDDNPETDRIISEILAQSDRGAAIIACGVLAEYLEHGISAKFRNISRRLRDKIFEGYGPLSTFASRVDLAYALDVISEPVYKDLLIIKTIRNQFAHSTNPIDFCSPEIAKNCANLQLYKNDIMLMDDPVNYENYDRCRFLSSVVMSIVWLNEMGFPVISWPQKSLL